MNIDKQLNNLHLKKIKSKKVGKGTDIFRLLPELKIKKIETPVIPVVIANSTKRNDQRAKSIKCVVEKKINGDKKIKLGLAKKYIFFAEQFKWEIPDRIKEIVANKKPYKPNSGKHGRFKQLARTTKPKKCPRTYKEYIKSKFWEDRKNKYYQTNGRQCAICGSSTQMSLHHLKYGKYSREKDEDLVALCWECHGEFHANYGVTKDCHKEFAEFCASKVNNPVIHKLSPLQHIKK